MRLERLAPLTGVGFPILIIVSFFVSGTTPDIDDPTPEIVSFWQDNSGRQSASAYLAGIAALCLLWFGGSLRRAILRGEGGDGRLAAISFGGTITAAIGLLLLAGVTFTLADAADNVPPEGVHALMALSYDLFLPLAGGAVVLLAAAGLAFIRTAVLPRWLGWAALVIALAILTPAGFVGLLAWLLWLAVVAILLYVRGTRESSTTAAAPAAAPGG